MPESVDSLELYKRALEKGITLTPGYIFSATQQYRNFIRLNVAYWSDKTVHAMQLLGQMIGDLAERPTARSPQ
jgi:DNA-binding transcriptional MocR family regulator